jgi:hypothetical protein
MTAAPIALPAAVGDYATRLHRAIGSVHHVASPLGAWLVLALAASAARDGSREPLRAALGCPVDEAAAVARALLSAPHPAVGLGVAAWRSVDSADLQAWLDGLTGVETGPMPTQREADAWAAEKTGGLITRFPAELDPAALLVLASAVACRIDWAVPFELASAATLDLAPSSGFAGVGQLLRTPPDAARHLVVDTADGLVAAHAAPSRDLDMLVVSVIADPSVESGAVLAHAHTIAVAMARDAEVDGARSLFDLPLGADHSWTLREQPVAAGSDQQRYTSILPAWSAESTHDLTDTDGFPQAADALRAVLPPDAHGPTMQARQVALARYTRTGFEAAAVTAMAMRAAAMRAREARLRTAALEFTHPFAVVAVAVAEPGSPWAGLPLFSAWVTRADEPA